ncbi:MAG: energy-coupling factor ABC transporter ATP-binding protein [Desulfovibrionales bacterium]|nr:energy-coupling factor ABC transporter ATP-binding protein [Desulfovibrionales bacterium]
MITVHNFCFTYADNTQKTLQNVNLTAGAGELVAIIGANGAGKTTLCHAISGVIPHLLHGSTQGSIHIAGNDIAKLDIASMANTVSLIMQNPEQMFSGIRFSVKEELAFTLENQGISLEEINTRVENAMREASILNLADSFPLHLSGGQMQKVALAIALVSNAPVLVLDEPTMSLDPESAQSIYEILKEVRGNGQTIFIAEQRLDYVARYADRVIAMHDGKIVLDGEPKDVLTSTVLSEIGLEWNRYTKISHLAQKRKMWDTTMPLGATYNDVINGLQRNDQ